MQDVEAVQRRFTHEATTQQKEASIAAAGNQVVPTDIQQLGPWTFVPQERCCASHIRTDGDCPDRQLVPRQQIAGERQEKRQHKQQYADHPVKFAGRLVTSRQKYAIHMQPDGDHHRMCTPTMHLTHDPQRRDVTQSKNVVESELQGRPVVKHQQNAGDCFYQKQKERDPPHTPRVRQRNPLLLDRHRMQMQKEVRQHHDDAVTAIHRSGMPKNTLPNLRAADVITNRHRFALIPPTQP